MSPLAGAARPGTGKQFRVPGKRYLGLAAGWGLLGAAACAWEFVISTMPSGMDGRDLQPWMQGVAWALDASMLPFCAIAPVLLLWSGYTCLRRAAGAGHPWTLAWCAAASASLACEALFLIRVVHMLATPYFNLGYMAWHAFDFSVAFLVIGAVMICVLIALRRSCQDPRGERQRRTGMT